MRLVLQPDFKIRTGKYLNPKKDHQVVVSFEQFDLIGM